MSVRRPVIDENIVLHTLIGEGSSGQVWTGVQRVDGSGSRPIVVKLINLVEYSGIRTIDERKTARLLQRFVSEVLVHELIALADEKRSGDLCNKVACRLRRDADLLVTYGMRGVLLFPLVSTQTLASLLLPQRRRRGRAGERQRQQRRNYTLRVMLDLARDVAALHEERIAHLDLKPANIIVVDVGATPNAQKTILIDVGLSCAAIGLLDNAKLLFEQKRQLIAEAIAKAFVGTSEWNFGPEQQLLLSLIGSVNLKEGVQCVVDRGSPLYMNRNLIGKSGFDAARREDMYAVGLIIYELARGRSLDSDMNGRPLGDTASIVRDGLNSTLTVVDDQRVRLIVLELLHADTSTWTMQTVVDYLQAAVNS